MDSLKQDIFECIRVSGDVTFAELHERLGERIEGEYTMFTSPDSNIVLWDDIAYEFIAAIGELLIEEKITVKYEPDTYEAYATKGALLPYPLARLPPESGYDDLHWLPAVVSPKRT
jgi:hypothetical protein